MPRTQSIARWLATLATVLILALYYLSMPFYAGSSIGPHINWRFEHARLKIEYRPSAYPESFWIDLNHEGLRYAPDYHFYASNDWFINVPLWAPFALIAPLTGYAWYRRFKPRHPPGHCPRCGYDRRTLPAGTQCPECGTGKPPRPNRPSR